MADSTLLNLTSAFSDDITDASSFFFYAVLSDDTPVNIPASEVRAGINRGRGVMVIAYTDQGLYTSVDSRVDITPDTVAYDDDSWWQSPNSATVLMVPDDTVEMVVPFYGYYSTSVVSHVVMELRYTTVSSTTYGSANPEIGGKSFRPTYFDHRYADHWSQGPRALKSSPPITVASGDQFLFSIGMSSTNSANVLSAMWGFYPFKFRRQ